MKEKEADIPWFTQKTNLALDTELASLTKAPGAPSRRGRHRAPSREGLRGPGRRVSTTGLHTPGNQLEKERERERERERENTRGPKL